MSGKGSIIVDFGAGGTNATAVVTGQASILSTSLCEAWIDGTDQAGSTDHNTDEHVMFSSVAGVTCRDLVAGTGFSIQVAANSSVTGKFNLLWVWA